MPVRSQLGLVGRVLQAGPGNSRVLLVTDTDLVPVRRAEDDVAAYARGAVTGTLVVRLISLGVNPLRKGDVLVTSGAGGLYRTGIRVCGRHGTDRGWRARARVISDPAATDYVMVEPISVEAGPVALPEPAAPGEPEGEKQ